MSPSGVAELLQPSCIQSMPENLHFRGTKK